MGKCPNKWFKEAALVQNFPTIIPVVAAALLDDQGRVLLQKRGPGRAHAGLWEFPGGKVEPAESLGQALIREIREELGIVLDPTLLEPLGFASEAGQPYVILLYTCRSWGGKAACLDDQEIGWFDAGALERLELVPLDIPLAARVREVLETAK
jgi:8-oxo-dGTP diphosphatase